MLKNSKFVSFCHLKKLVRPETFGFYHVAYQYTRNALFPFNGNSDYTNAPQYAVICTLARLFTSKSFRFLTFKNLYIGRA